MKRPVCPDHAIPMTRLQPDGAPLHGQIWWLCEVEHMVSITQRARCGNTATS
jgi:hypothetical protein